jgi:hypothetical protein
LTESDGAKTLLAIARDTAGNERRGTRTLEIDNTIPVPVLQATGYHVDEVTGVWWTADSAPVLRGTLTELHPDKVEVVVDGVVGRGPGGQGDRGRR